MVRLIHVTVAVLLLSACGSQPQPRREAAEHAASQGEPAEPSPPAMRFAAQDAGAPDVGAARLHILEAGKISLPNGRIAVADAFINDDPLVVSELPAGDYSVELLVGDSGPDERVAAARVRFRIGPPASWRRAGYLSVDSGNGAFFDPRISSTLGSVNILNFNNNLLKALEESQRNTYSIASLSWEGMTFVAFSTGWGDGSYPVYVGLSAAGAPLTVVVDCEILPWPK